MVEKHDVTGARHPQLAEAVVLLGSVQHTTRYT
jgi:hypothetical protein